MTSSNYNRDSITFRLFSCCPFAAVPADDQPGAHRPKRPPEVFVCPAAVEPAAGLPRGLGPAHRPQHEGRDQAGIHTEALLSGRDGRRSLQARRDGNFRRADSFRGAHVEGCEPLDHADLLLPGFSLRGNVCSLPLGGGKTRVGEINQLQAGKASLHMLPI